MRLPYYESWEVIRIIGTIAIRSPIHSNCWFYPAYFYRPYSSLRFWTWSWIARTLPESLLMQSYQADVRAASQNSQHQVSLDPSLFETSNFGSQACGDFMICPHGRSVHEAIQHIFGAKGNPHFSFPYQYHLEIINQINQTNGWAIIFHPWRFFYSFYSQLLTSNRLLNERFHENFVLLHCALPERFQNSHYYIFAAV